MGEQVDPASRGDVHEAWDMGADDQKMVDGQTSSGNLWPPAEDLPGFKPALQTTWLVSRSLWGSSRPEDITGSMSR
jgi:hypothetical protein